MVANTIRVQVYFSNFWLEFNWMDSVILYEPLDGFDGENCMLDGSNGWVSWAHLHYRHPIN